jgi:uncharacterized protein
MIPLETLRSKLISIAEELYPNDDPSHDINHILRVLANIEMLQKQEGGDLYILIPAALFHDVVNYPKLDPRAPLATDESAAKAAEILEAIEGYPKEKIEKVSYAISVCSFSKGIKPETLEAALLQDADMLESTGAISIMRVFASSGNVHRRFFDPKDPFAENREFDNKSNGLDLFPMRLYKIPERMNTKLGKKLALERMKILDSFMNALRSEVLI